MLQLNEKVQILEKSLSHVVREFEVERKAIVHKAEIERDAAKVEIVKLQRVIELKTREMNKVKRLAKNILDERTELERFFLQSLDQVKAEIAANRYVAAVFFCWFFFFFLLVFFYFLNFSYQNLSDSE